MRNFRGCLMLMPFVALCFATPIFATPFAYVVAPVDSSELTFEPFGDQVNFLGRPIGPQICAAEPAAPLPASTSKRAQAQRANQLASAAFALQMLKAVGCFSGASGLAK